MANKLIEICDECQKRVKNIYHLKPAKNDKIMTKDWHVCPQCFVENYNVMTKVKNLLNKINYECVKGYIPRKCYISFIASLKENLPTKKQLQDIKDNAI